MGIKYWGWYPSLSYANNRYIFAEYIIELGILAVKSGWVGGDKSILALVVEHDYK